MNNIDPTPGPEPLEEKENTSEEFRLRDMKEPWPRTPEELLKTIKELVDLKHTYGTCVYALSLSAVAAFNYVAHALGVTGFQASMADLDIIKRTRHLKGGFILLKMEDLLYPQYDLRKKLEDFITSDDTKKWLKDEATKKLAESHAHANEAVVAHWRKLAE